MRRSTRIRCFPLLLFITACGSGSEVWEPSGRGGERGDGDGDGSAELTGASEPGYFLRVNDAPVPPVELDLDKAKALRLFGPEAARRIHLLDVDPERLLQNAVYAIRDACGTSWREDTPSPDYDCQRTPLGESFGPNFRVSPEFALVRLLGLTPANAALRGTSLEDLARLFAENEALLRVDFGSLLSESLGIPRTSPILPIEPIVRSLREQLLNTHPTLQRASGKLPITLADALQDLRTLPEKLGPSGAHPGVLLPDDAGFTTAGNVLLPDFRMHVIATSNLRLVEGVALGRGAGEMFLLEGDAPLSFDFTDPNRLGLTGIAESPTLDMRFAIREFAGMVPACRGDNACKANLPGKPTGAGTVWTVPPWLLEPIIARAGLIMYGGRTFSRCYLILGENCLSGISIGADRDPTGWATFANDFRSVRVPAPQYLWELLTEVAQIALHDPDGDGSPDIPEGQAEPVFALRGVGIGLSREEIIAAMRPNLQAQASEIANVLLGAYWKRNDPLDFFYRRATRQGPPLLYFVAREDLRPDPNNPSEARPYTYDRPGFYLSPNLDPRSRVSVTRIPGIPDTTHEKFRLPAGETTLYMQDDAHRVYAVVFAVPEGDPVEIVARVKSL
jgi:hypothetical protein